MAKCVIGYSGTTYGTQASSGLGAVFGSAAVTPTVAFTPAKNPDGTAVKDTRK
jgi:hypothetical protein